MRDVVLGPGRLRCGNGRGGEPGRHTPARLLVEQPFGGAHHLPPKSGGTGVIGGREFDKTNAAHSNRGLAQFINQAGREDKHVEIGVHDPYEPTAAAFVPP